MVNFYELPKNVLNGSKDIIKNSVCTLNFNTALYLYIIPFIVFLIFLILIRYKDFLMYKFLRFKSHIGYIKILFIKENKTIEEKLIKLDKYNTFNIGKRKFTLEKMHDFIIGYDKNNFPVFMYDINFIIPLKIEKTEIDKTFINDIPKEISDINGKNVNEISQLVLKIDSTILRTVYDKKLLSDLYSISTEDIKFKKIILYSILGILGFIILYYTGLLSKILAFLGIQGF